MKKLMLVLLIVPIMISVILSNVFAQPGVRVVLETTSPYHHIKVYDEGNIRVLSFDGSMETKMSLANHLRGHFEYTEYFQMPWLWNNEIKQVCMIGLGGGSTQRAYQYYYPYVEIHSVELDPKVIDIAKEFFNVKENEFHRIYNMDGRQYLRRSKGGYDSIIMDAYTTNRYGSYIPYHLATKEFFEIASDKMADNGVLCYNVIGQIYGDRADIIGALYVTMKQVFPHVYMFPSNTSQNVVIVATKTDKPLTTALVRERTEALFSKGTIKHADFRARTHSFRDFAPSAANRSPVLTDDFAPTDGLLTGARR